MKDVIFTGKREEMTLFFLGLRDDTTVFDLIEHKEKRGLSQNNYYWQLLEKLSVKTHVPKQKIHNINLRHLGLMERINGQVVSVLLPDAEETEETVLMADTYHLVPTRKTKEGTDGKMYRWYLMLRGSSDMNVSEMSALVDLAVQDAKAQGIETLTPNELAHIRELEKQHEDKKNQGMCDKPQGQGRS